MEPRFSPNSVCHSHLLWRSTSNDLLVNGVMAWFSPQVLAYSLTVIKQDISLHNWQPHVYKMRSATSMTLSSLGVCCVWLFTGSNCDGLCCFQPTWERWSSACSLIRRTTAFIVLFTRQRYMQFQYHKTTSPMMLLCLHKMPKCSLSPPLLEK